MKPYLLAVTGGIGSGKSTVSHYFAERQLPVLDLDQVGHLLLTEEDVKLALYLQFGADICANDGAIDRGKLAARCFLDSAAMATLNGVMHPKIWQYVLQWMDAQPNEKILVIEASVLIEAGFASRVDGVLVVMADRAIRQQRVALRDCCSEERFHQITAMQCSDASRRAVADWVIENNHDLLSLRTKIEAVYNELLNRVRGALT
ncbi:MAG: dephospho-CoA kinase [Zetaproteobacteria bacterium]|nr:dephospho-CoA kinase [Zetaproteobacteria bacterium]